MDKRCCKTSNIEEESQNSPSSNQGTNLRRLRSEHGLQTLRLENMQLGEKHDQQSDQTHNEASSSNKHREIRDFSTRQFELHEVQQQEVQEHNQLQLQPRDSSRLHDKAFKQAYLTFVMDSFRVAGQYKDRHWSKNEMPWVEPMATAVGEYFRGKIANQYSIIPDKASLERIFKTFFLETCKTVIPYCIGIFLTKRLGRKLRQLEGGLFNLGTVAIASAGTAYGLEQIYALVSNKIEATWRSLLQQPNQASEHTLSDILKFNNERSLKQARQAFILIAVRKLCKDATKDICPSWAIPIAAPLARYIDGLCVEPHSIIPNIESQNLITTTFSKLVARIPIADRIFKYLMTNSDVCRKEPLRAATFILTKATSASVAVFVTILYREFIRNLIRSGLDPVNKELERRQIEQGAQLAQDVQLAQNVQLAQDVQLAQGEQLAQGVQLEHGHHDKHGDQIHHRHHRDQKHHGKQIHHEHHMEHGD